MNGLVAYTKLPHTMSKLLSRGTSASAPFVTGAIALLWSEFPKAISAQIKFAVVQSHTRRTSVVPPLLNAWGAYQTLNVNLRR